MAAITVASLDQFKAGATVALTDALNGLIAGETADIKNWAAEMLSNAIEAGAAGRQDLLAVIAQQALVLLEIKRLRAQESSKEVILRILNLALGVAATFAVPAPLQPLANAVITAAGQVIGGQG